MAITDTGWKGIEIVGGDGDRGAAGIVEPVTGLEAKPCLACVSFEKDVERLQRHIVAHGLTPDADGRFETPIAKDFQGRTSLKLDPRNFGWCRRNCEVTDMLTTCPAWQPLHSVADLTRRIR